MSQKEKHSKIERIPETLFQEDGHYLGKPAEFDERIVSRRLRLLENTPNFINRKCSLLDIGCGNGASIFMLSNRMDYCVGIDVTQIHENEFNRYKAKQNISNCEFRLQDVVNSKAKETFDRIISFEVIEHLSDEAGLDFYYNSLKQDGLMAITVPNKWWIFETHGATLPLLKWNRVPFFSWLPKPVHEKFANARIYSKKRILKLLNKHGFKVLRTEYITAPMDVLSPGKFKDWIIKYIFNSDTTKIPFKATSIFVLAKKK